MPRTLTIVERRVNEAERAEYLAALPVRRQRAAAVPAHFWVFEHTTERGRFVEFSEAPGEDQLRALHGTEIPGDRWCEVQGG